MMDDLSEIHAVPLNKWIEGIIFKFSGDNLDMKKGVRDLRANNQGDIDGIEVQHVCIGCPDEE